MSTPTPGERAALKAASSWYASLNSGSSGAAEQQAWQHWYDADPVHRQAWQQIERLRDQLGLLPAQIAAPTLRGAAYSRRRVLGSLLLAGAALPLGWFAWRSDSRRYWTADYRSGAGEQRHWQLADGSRLLLGSAGAAQFDGTRRQLQLLDGEAQLDIADGPQALQVLTRDGLIRAGGGRLNLRCDPHGSRIALLEGSVEVSCAAQPARWQRLQAGQQLLLQRERIGAPQPLDARSTAWAEGSLLAIDQPLGEVVAELARYRHGILRVDPALAGLKVSGSFPLLDSDRALAALQHSFPLQVVRRSDYWVTLVPRGA
ncbi:FecR domain-containing protein [Bowmanella yangjiangensis]|uniref:DUF4880 domain-containing protein n=1 Tax=Bowmanella yangjiangensis TaxID=2811230 RepID=A0ABS3D4H2_9ALTE|nr:FecR domain-containing protein [Bowmanella yangjiangensis]MBN7822909.1 DUF4880 domain-containing protein [Bowmanella yangjiangensis]